MVHATNQFREEGIGIVIRNSRSACVVYGYRYIQEKEVLYSEALAVKVSNVSTEN